MSIQDQSEWTKASSLGGFLFLLSPFSLFGWPDALLCSSGQRLTCDNSSSSSLPSPRHVHPAVKTLLVCMCYGAQMIWGPQELVLSYLCASCGGNSGMSDWVAGAFTEPPHWAFWKMRIMTEDPMLTELGKKTVLSSTHAPWSHVRGTQWLKGLSKAISWCFLMVHFIFAPHKECYIWGPEHPAKAHVRCVPKVVLFGGIRDLSERGILSHSGGGSIHLERTMGQVSSFFSSFPAISKQLCSTTYSAKMSLLTTDTEQWSQPTVDWDFPTLGLNHSFLSEYLL